MSDFKIIKTLNYNAAITIINIIFGILINILLVQQLGLRDFGNLSIVLVYSSIVYSISVFGLGSTLVYKFIQYRRINVNIKPLILMLFGFVQIIAIILLIIIYKTGIIGHFEIKNTSFIVLSVLLQTGLGFPVALFTAYFESIQSLRVVFFSTLISILVKLLGLLCITIFPQKILVSLFAIYLIPNIVSFVLLGFSFNSNYLKPIHSEKINNIKEFLNTLSFSIKLMPVIFAELILANFILVFFGRINNAETLAVIRILLGIFTMALTIPSIIGRTMLPFYSSLFMRSKLRNLNLYNSLTFKVSFLFFCAFTTVLILFTKEILTLYKIDYTTYENWYYIIVLMIFLMFSSYQGSILIAISKPQYVSLILVTGAFIHVVLGYFLYQHLLVFGLLISLGLSYLLMQIILNLLLINKLHFVFNYQLIVVFSFSLLTQFIFKNYVLDQYIGLRLILFILYLLISIVYVKKFSFFNVREFEIMKFFTVMLKKRLI